MLSFTLEYQFLVKKKLKVKKLYLKSSFDDWKLRRIKHNSLNISLLRTIVPHNLVFFKSLPFLDLVDTRLHSENAVRRSIYPYVSKYNYVSVRNTRVKNNFSGIWSFTCTSNVSYRVPLGKECTVTWKQISM